MFHVFILCSGIAAGVNIAVGFLLYDLFGLDSTVGYAFSVAVAFLCGMGVSFALNRHHTFARTDRHIGSEMRSFLAVSLGGVCLTTVLSLFFVTAGQGVFQALGGTVLSAHTTSHVLAVGLTAIYSFLGHKYVSFRHRDAELPFKSKQMALPAISARRS